MMQNARKATLGPELGVHIDVELQTQDTSRCERIEIVGEVAMETQVNGTCGTWLLTKQSCYQMDFASLRSRFQNISAIGISVATE
jgi:hypothetical protein